MAHVSVARKAGLAATLAIWCVANAGCSLKRIAINRMADTLATGAGSAFASDEDPELIRDAAPFSLKLVESLLVDVPNHKGLLLTACSGFTQYAYAFVDGDAEVVKADSYAQFEKLEARAQRMYLRARDYCLRSLERRYPGIRQRLIADPDAAVSVAKRDDVPLLYWTAAAWGRAVSLSLDQPALIGDFPAVRALMRRALALDESFNSGALHEAMIALEAMPESMGGSRQRARSHFDRAVVLSNGLSAGPYLAFARSVSLPERNRSEFVRLLTLALEIDVNREPDLRLANVLGQQQARYLLDHLDDLFLSDTNAGAEGRALVRPR